MEIILKEDVANLGFENEIVNVKNGYARNYLFPRRLAIPATESNKKMLAENLKQKARKLEQLKANAETTAAQLNNLTVVVEVKANAEGGIYGSVTNTIVADALKEQHNIELDRKKIVFASAIKDLGQFKVNVPLHKEVKAEFIVDVVAE